MATLLLCDLDLVAETDQTMVMDKSKFRNKLIGNFTRSDGDEQMDAVYFDDRKDQTILTRRYKGLLHQKKKHYALVRQTPGEYLTHLALQSGNAAAISEAIIEFTGKYNINAELKVVAIQPMSTLAAWEQQLTELRKKSDAG